MYYLQYQSVFYSDVSMLIGYQHKKIGGSTISKRQQSRFKDDEAHTWGTVLSSYLGSEETHTGHWCADGDDGLVALPTDWWYWLQAVCTVGELRYYCKTVYLLP